MQFAFIDRVVSQPGGLWFMIGFGFLFLVVLVALIFRFKEHFKVVWPYVLMIFALGTLSLANSYGTQVPIDAEEKEDKEDARVVENDDTIKKDEHSVSSVMKFWNESVSEIITHTVGADLFVDVPSGEEIYKYKISLKAKYGLKSDVKFQEMTPYVMEQRNEPGQEPYMRLLVYCPDFEKTGLEVGIPTLLSKKKPKKSGLWTKALADGINKFKEKLDDEKGAEKAKDEFKKIWHSRLLKIFSKEGKVHVEFEWADDAETFDLVKQQSEKRKLEEAKRRHLEEGR